MSLRARRLQVGTVDVERFAWSPTETGGHIESPRASHIWASYDDQAVATHGARSTSTAAPGPVAPEPSQPTAEQQLLVFAIQGDDAHDHVRISLEQLGYL